MKNMNMDYNNILSCGSDTITWRLEKLFKNHGFLKTGIRKFEDYSLYVDNMSFLETTNIISFMNLEGKLVALKPDITLSIMKNIPKRELPFFEKLYYVDEVYRLNKETSEFKEVKQIGVELVGKKDEFSNAEIINLALESLKTISNSYVLDISHVGFISALLDDMKLTGRVKSNTLNAIHSKSVHLIKNILNDYVTEKDIKDIEKLCLISGAFSKTLTDIKSLIRNEDMQKAYNELIYIKDFLVSMNKDENVTLEFSVTGDLDYYNGVVFNGYIKGFHKELLSGGRYDKLLDKMNKNNCSIGFAINLPEYSEFSDKSFDFDIFITYSDGSEKGKFMKEIEKLIEQGKSVRLEKDFDEGTRVPFTFEKRYKFENDSLKEVK